MKATEVTTGLAERNGSLLPGIWRDSLHITCRLTACTPGSSPGPALDNDYGKTFFCLFFHPCHDLKQTKHDFSFNRVTLPRTYLDSILFEDRHFFVFSSYPCYLWLHLFSRWVRRYYVYGLSVCVCIRMCMHSSRGIFRSAC